MKSSFKKFYGEFIGKVGLKLRPKVGAKLLGRFKKI
jgi:hypothetical protein